MCLTREIEAMYDRPKTISRVSMQPFTVLVHLSWGSILYTEIFYTDYSFYSIQSEELKQKYTCAG